METDDPLEGLRPTDYLMEIAWAGCVHYAIGNPEILAAFREETGDEPIR